MSEAPAANPPDHPEKVTELPKIYRPTSGARELFIAAFKDERVTQIFEQATPFEESRFLPEVKKTFMDYVVETYGLNYFEAEEIFDRLSFRKYSPNAKA